MLNAECVEYFISSSRFAVTLHEPQGAPAFVLKQALTPEAEILIQNEIQMLKRVSNRQFIQEIITHDSASFTNTAYNGGDLFTYMEEMQKNRTQPDQDFIRIIEKGIFKGLEVIHADGITHHDIKPENSFLHHQARRPHGPKNQRLRIRNTRRRQARRRDQVSTTLASVALRGLCPDSPLFCPVHSSHLNITG